MIYDIQKGSLLKRISAWFLDAILLCVLAAGCIWAVSGIVNYDAHSMAMENYYTQYETEYNTSFSYNSQQLLELTEEELARYEAACEAMANDAQVIATYNMVLQLTLLMACIGIFLAKLILEFFVPMALKNGQTIGKKVFGLGVMRSNGLRLGNTSLFIRAVLGKYAIETMVPVFIVIMWLLGLVGIGGTAVLLALSAIQLGMLVATATNSLIHDKLADTVVVDLASQMIFETEEDRQAYIDRIAAEKDERRAY